MVTVSMAGLGAAVAGIEMRARRVKPAILQGLRYKAEYLAGEMRRRFDNVKPANARVTKFLKGSSKPLVNDADLRNSIGVIEGDDEFSLLIGVPAGRNAKLAAIHEGGAIIVQEMTEKQRRWMFANLPKQTEREKAVAAGRSQGTGIIVIHIPARPFIGPTFERAAKKAAEIFMISFSKDMA